MGFLRKKGTKSDKKDIKKEPAKIASENPPPNKSAPAARVVSGTPRDNHDGRTTSDSAVVAENFEMRPLVAENFELREAFLGKKINDSFLITKMRRESRSGVASLVSQNSDDAVNDLTAITWTDTVAVEEENYCGDVAEEEEARDDHGAKGLAAIEEVDRDAVTDQREWDRRNTSVQQGDGAVEKRVPRWCMDLSDHVTGLRGLLPLKGAHATGTKGAPP